MKTRIVRALAVVLCCVTPISAAAQAVTLGSPLAIEPNFPIATGCELQPTIIDTSGNFGPVLSGQADCTWRQSGVFGVPNDTRFSSVPGDGRIVSISVRAAANPAPLRFVIMRQLSTPGFGAESQCCFFQSETNTVQPASNTVSTFATNIPVQRNTINGFLAVDLVGFSAQSGTGTLPLSVVQAPNAFNLTQFGSVNAGFFYPRVGAIPNDAGGGRREEGIPGVEVLLQFTWVPNIGALVTSSTGRSVQNQVPIIINCRGDAICRGVVQLFAVTAGLQGRGIRAAMAVGARAKQVSYGRISYTVKAGKTKSVKITLSRKGKNALKNSGGTLPALLSLTPRGGMPEVSNFTVTKPSRRRR